ncbi:MAG: EAL domain-containing protein [Rhodoferax sp.]|nr:EAL domain-containing protein [Rhodoferax sp.]
MRRHTPRPVTTRWGRSRFCSSASTAAGHWYRCPDMRRATSAQSLRQRIERELSRLVSTYVLVTAGLLGVLWIGISYYRVADALKEQRNLVVTKLGADLDNVIQEARALAGTPVLWTGLTDSFGREAYLRPVLERFGQGRMHRLMVLDYRGRRFYSADPAFPERAIASEPTRKAVAQGVPSWGLLPAAEGSRALLVIVVPVISPQTPSPVGYIVVALDPIATLGALAVDPEFSLVFEDPFRRAPASAAQLTTLRSEGLVRAGAPPLDVALHVEVGHGSGELVRDALLVSGVMTLLGFLLLRRVQRWSGQFAASTTDRLDQLVTYCRDVLDGRRIEAELDNTQDEISAVFQTLRQMLNRQREVTQDLRRAAKVFETSAEAIVLTDGSGQILDANPALLRMTGYLREDLIGQPAGLLYRDVDDPTVSRDIRQAMADHDQWRGETLFRHRDGTLIPASVSLSRLHDDHGAVLGQVAMIVDIRAIKEAEAQLRFLAYHDNLTGLPNFRMLTETLQRRLADPAAASRPFLLAFFDMDHLKSVNDSYGHDMGDTVIKALSEHLSRRLPQPHLLCRRSGDEFVAVIDGPDGIGEDLLHQQLDDSLCAFEVEGEEGLFSVSVSAGIARYPADAANLADLLVCADGAVNEVKQKGRSAVGWFNPHLGQRLQRQRRIQVRLAAAIDSGKIHVRYQPEVQLRDGRVTGFEALARWDDPELGVIQPAEFIPVAEESHLIERLTMRVVTQLLADQPQILQRFPGTVLSVNIAPQVFRSHALLDLLTAHGAASPGALDLLQIELSEADIALASEAVIDQLRRLRELGLNISIDDFGGGFSSIQRLADIQIRRLKVDRSLVGGLWGRGGDRVVGVALHLGRVLEVQVSAKGVETESQRQALLDLGCYRAQGWLFARELPLADVLNLPQQLVVPKSD